MAEEGETIEIHSEVAVEVTTTHLAPQIVSSVEKLVIFRASVPQLDRINVSGVERKVIEKGIVQTCLNFNVIIVMEKDIFRESVQSQDRVVVVAAAAGELAIIVMRKVTCQETVQSHDQVVEEVDVEELHEEVSNLFSYF